MRDMSALEVLQFHGIALYKSTLTHFDTHALKEIKTSLRTSLSFIELVLKSKTPIVSSMKYHRFQSK